MPLIRKRRADPASQPSNDNASSDPEDPPTHRRRTEDSPASNTDPDTDSSDNDEPRAPSSTDVMVKKLVRLALASEYSRQPIRRNDITTKVLAEQGSRPFKTVFEESQKSLRKWFGMEMVELPQKEKVTISQRRAAQRAEKGSSSNKSWMVCSTLPQGYRTPEIITPNKVSSAATESSYTALYTFIISVIMLNGGSLQEQKLDRYLSRTNADSYTPIDRTDRLIQRLCKEGYIVRNREMDGGEEVIEYMVGPRGKAEVGSLGVAELAREVYGFQDGEEGGSRGEEFESRLQRSLGLRRRVVIEDGGEGNGENGNEERQAGNGNGSAGESDASGG